MSEIEEVVYELRKISKILLFTNSNIIEAELTKLMVTDERKKMWVLTDGIRMPKEIAKLVGVSTISISRFLTLTVSAGLIEYEKGKPPIRVLDYAPSGWVELLNDTEAAVGPTED